MNAEPTEDDARVGRIWKNAAWLGAIPLLLNVVSLLSTGYIARVLGTAAFGRFSMAAAIVALTAPIADFGLRALTVRELARAGRGAKRALGDLLSLRLLLAVITTVVAASIALIVSSASGLAPVILVTALTIIPVTIAGTLSDGLMSRDRAREISGAVFWSGLLLTIVSVIAAAVWHTATMLAAAYVVGPVVNMLVLAHHTRADHGAIIFRWRPSHWRVLLRRSMPFFRLGILSMVIGRLDTVVVGSLFGQAMAGIYAAATSLADRLYILIDSVASAVLPTLSRLRTEPRRVEGVLAQVLFPLLAMLSAGALLGAVGATAVVTVIFGPEYAVGGPVLAVALLYLPVLALDVLLSEGFLAMRRDSYVASTGIRAQVVTLILLPLFAMAFGMPGARGCRVAGTLASVVPRWRASRELFPTLWSRERLRRLGLGILLALPVTIILAIWRFHPLLTVVLSGSAFLLWSAATAQLSGGLPMLRALLTKHSAPVSLGEATPRDWTRSEVLELAAAVESAPGRTTPPTTIRFSVVIPCYNAEATVAETIESVLRQSVAPLEIIVSDDRSTDGSVAVASRYPVRVLQAAENGGCGVARNLGMAVARGEAIALLDADDLWDADHLATLQRLLESNPAAGVAFTLIEKFDDQGPLDPSPMPSWPARTPFDPSADLLSGNFITPSAVAIRRDLWGRAGGFDPSYRSAEDYEFWFRLARLTRFVGERRTTVHYRVHSNQMSMNFKPLVDHIWKVRHRELDAMHGPDQPERRQILSETWRASLKAAVAVRSREALASVLQAGAPFPEHRWTMARWRLVERTWPVTSRILRVWDSIPIHVRRPFRGPRGVIIKPQL